MRLSLLLLLPIALLATAADPQHHTFSAGDYVVTMDVLFLEPYVGKRLVFYNSADPGKEICAVRIGPSGVCPERFVGAAATVTFTVKRTDGKVPGQKSIREYVTVISQSSGLEPRPPFETTQPLSRGVMSDLQVFGYDETSIAEGERAASRKESQKRWRLYRQELYLNSDTEPFAVVQWRHTLDRIEILHVKRR